MHSSPPLGNGTKNMYLSEIEEPISFICYEKKFLLVPIGGLIFCM